MVSEGRTNTWMGVRGCFLSTRRAISTLCDITKRWFLSDNSTLPSFCIMLKNYLSHCHSIPSQWKWIYPWSWQKRRCAPLGEGTAASGWCEALGEWQCDRVLPVQCRTPPLVSSSQCVASHAPHAPSGTCALCLLWHNACWCIPLRVYNTATDRSTDRQTDNLATHHHHTFDRWTLGHVGNEIVTFWNSQTK